MSLPRFLVSQIPELGSATQLDEAEARHASNVLRLKSGSEVLLFDGRGGEALAQLDEVSKRSVSARCLQRLDSPRELARPMDLYVALPKGDRQKTLIEGAVQLGVTRLIPLVCERGVARPVASAIDRLQRAVVEASKQCGRNQLMEVAEPVDVGDFEAAGDGELRCFAHPYGQTQTLHSLAARAAIAKRCVAIIGPEGGFTDEECQLLGSRGGIATSLGPRILRVEVAAMAVACWWSQAESQH